jgi:hypothetical protein
MHTSSIDPAIHAFIARVVHVGSAYDMDGMDTLYVADQSILVLNADGTVTRISRADMMGEFRSRRDTGEPPLSTEYTVLHVEQQGDDATALLYRRMSPSAKPVMYELRLRKEHLAGWLVAGETVTPWPDPETDAGAFLPPRHPAH